MVRRARPTRFPLATRVMVVVLATGACASCAGYTSDAHGPRLDTPEYHSRADVEHLVEQAQIPCDTLTEEQQEPVLDERDPVLLVTCTRQGRPALQMNIHATPAQAREVTFVLPPDKPYYMLRGSNWIASLESAALLKQLSAITGGVEVTHRSQA